MNLLDICIPIGGVWPCEGKLNGEPMPIGAKYTTAFPRNFPNGGELQEVEFEVIAFDKVKRIR